jgi:hypothetical protein
MKTLLVIVPPFLFVSTPLSAASADIPGGLKYDRLAAFHERGGDARSYGVSGQALLGGRFLVGGQASEESFPTLGDISGRSTGFTLGYKFTEATGDFLITVTRSQNRAGGVAGAVTWELDGEATTLGLTWRQRLSDTLEGFVGYGHTSHRETSRATLGGIVTSSRGRGQEGALNLALRFNATANADVTAGYAIVTGGNVWSIATGYNF